MHRFRTSGFSMLSLLWDRIFDMTPPNINTKGRATCDSKSLLPFKTTLLLTVHRTGYNETKDRVGPSSSSLISKKMALSERPSVQSPMQ